MNGGREGRGRSGRVDFRVAASARERGEVGARFLVFNTSNANATRAFDSRTARAIQLEAPGTATPPTRSRRLSLVFTTILAYFFLPPWAAFAARAASSAAMAACA